MEHAKSVFFRFDTTYAFDSPLPVNPKFPPVAAAAPGVATATGPATRASTQLASASLPSQPLSVTTPPRVLTDFEHARFVVSPEHMENVDRQLMEAMLSTIDSAAARIPYRSRCNGSGSLLIRLLVAESNAASSAVAAAIEALMRALESDQGHA
eukprot:5122164-Pleurochrysis_carterae.AAC.2